MSVLPEPARAAFLLGSLAVACSSSPRAVGAAPSDAGRDVAHDVGPDGLSCTGTDVFCDGVCQQESVDACGPSCTVCDQPASSHGTADCFENKCDFQCEGGYVRCATISCCGAQTAGDVAEVGVGGETSCGVTTGGAILCWGDGSYGALGDGNTSDESLVPTAVLNLPSIAAHVALGDHHACSLLANGGVVCWGNDQQGELGDGQTTPRATATTPLGLTSGVAQVAVGGMHSCALSKATGGLQCWGDNASGQLGNTGVGASSTQPVPVTGLSSGVAAVTAGEAFTCALLSNGQVQCWGDGANGQLGGAPTGPKPVVVSMPTGVTAIAAGAHHVCAITAGEGVICWGAGDVNQLGSSHASAQIAPLTVPMVSAVVALSAGGDETCALDHSGAVHCWGADPIGDVGMGPAGPGIVPSLTGGIAHLSARSGHACAVTTLGAPKCWGTNGAGELGDNTMTTSWVPIDVTGI